MPSTSPSLPTEQPPIINSPENNLPENNGITPQKKPSKKLLIIASVVLLVAGATAAALTKNKSQLSSAKQSYAQKIIKPKAVEQVFVSPIDGKKTEIKEVQYYDVTVGTTDYYGRVSKINNDYIRMLPTAYKAKNALVFTGDELHGPEPATYFHISQVTKFQELTDTTILNALKANTSTVSDAFPSSSINKYLKAGQFQAFFFADGMSFFAKTSSLTGAFLANSSHVYILKSEAVNNSSGSRTQVSLVLAKPEEYNTRTAKDLQYWQNMKSDSQISKAAIMFEKRNP
ncbi:MAG: hypothetical protein ACXWLH_06015 [Candidatus Saccharimonadales bacterium]